MLFSLICEPHHQLNLQVSVMMDMVRGEEDGGGWPPLLVKHEMTTGRRPDGRGSGKHTGVVGIQVLHAHDICTYSTLVYGVVES